MRVQVGAVAALLLALGAVGCADTADLLPANQQAQAVGSPKLYYFKGVPGMPAKVVMPDGETLPGTVSVDETGAAAAAPGSKGNFSASARGPRTVMTCGGSMVAGHGVAECRDQNGAIYRGQL